MYICILIGTSLQSQTIKTITYVFKQNYVLKKKGKFLCAETRASKGFLTLLRLKDRHLEVQLTKNPNTHHNKNANPHPTLIKIFLLSRIASKQ